MVRGGTIAGVLAVLAQYYEKGRYVQQDKRQAVVLMHEAAALVTLRPNGMAVMLDQAGGSPLDYEELIAGYITVSFPMINSMPAPPACYDNLRHGCL